MFFVILVVWCVIVAWLEVEIEGKDGWAKNAPTWKYKLDDSGKLWYKPFGLAQEYVEPVCGNSKRWFYTLYIKKMLGGREFTGYHRAVDVMQLFVAHLVVYLLGHDATWWNLEVRVVAFIFLSWSIEDTLWFILNPFYGIKKYKPEFIPWHANDWWWFAPKGMIILFVQGVAIYVATWGIEVFLR